MPRLITLSPDAATFAAVQTELASIANGANKAFATAINRTLTTVRSRVAKRLAKTINLPAGNASTPDEGTVSGFIDVQKASSGGTGGAANLEGAVSITGKPISLMLFKPTPSQPGPTRVAGVSVLTRRGKARELLKHTFVARMKSGHTGVFERMGRGNKRVRRLRIQERFGPTPYGVFENAPGIAEEILADAGDVLEKNILSQVDRLLDRSKADRPA